MSSLANLQHAFGAMLFDTSAPYLDDDVVDPKSRGQAGLMIYRNNVLSSLTDALKDAYPVVEKLVGADFFQSCAHAYIRQYPTNNPILAFYGQHFATFLENHYPAQSLPYLPDVARLEHAWLQAYHAASAGPVDVQQAFQSCPPETMGEVRFELHPSVHLVESTFPVFRIWEMNTEDEETTEPVSLDDGGSWVMIFRPKFKVEVRDLSQAFYIFLHHLREGVTLTTAYEAAMEHDASFDLQQALQTCLIEHIFTKLILPEEGSL